MDSPGSACRGHVVCVSDQWVQARWLAALLVGWGALGCGGGGGAKQTGDAGGGTSITSSGGASGAAGAQAGGAGGTGGADAAVSKGDAWIANPDQAAARSDSTVGGDTCPAITACGGDIVGTWHLTSICGSSPNSSACVETLTTDRSAMQLEYTFGRDGTLAISYSGSIRQTARYLFTCFGRSDAGPEQTCSGLQDMAQAAMRTDAGPASFTATEFRCTADSTGCICDETFAIAPINVTGTYAVNGNRLVVVTVTDAGPTDAGPQGSAEYCVSGNTLAIHFQDDNGASSTSFLAK